MPRQFTLPNGNVIDAAGAHDSPQWAAAMEAHNAAMQLPEQVSGARPPGVKDQPAPKPRSNVIGSRG